MNELSPRTLDGLFPLIDYFEEKDSQKWKLAKIIIDPKLISKVFEDFKQKDGSIFTISDREITVEATDTMIDLIEDEYYKGIRKIYQFVLFQKLEVIEIPDDFDKIIINDSTPSSRKDIRKIQALQNFLHENDSRKDLERAVGKYLIPLKARINANFQTSPKTTPPTRPSSPPLKSNSPPKRMPSPPTQMTMLSLPPQAMSSYEIRIIPPSTPLSSEQSNLDDFAAKTL